MRLKKRKMTQKKNDQKDLMQIKNIVLTALALCVVISLIGLWFTPPIPWVLGAAFGLIIALLCFRLLYLTLQKSLSKEKKSAKFYSMTTYTVRYIIKGFALYAAFKSPYLNWVSAALGLVSINVAIHVLNILNIIFAKSKERSD